jgi:hypothetical protein
VAKEVGERHLRQHRLKTSWRSTSAATVLFGGTQTDAPGESMLQAARCAPVREADRAGDLLQHPGSCARLSWHPLAMPYLPARAFSEVVGSQLLPWVG